MVKHFEIDQCVEFREEVVDFVNLVELNFKIEKAELSFGLCHDRSGRGGTEAETRHVRIF